MKGFVWLLTFVMFVQPLPAKTPANSLINAKDFPSVAARIPFFEKRINATDPQVREQVVVEAGYFYRLPDKDYVQFLKRIMRDSEPWIRGQAIQKLHDLWVPLEVENLPLTFC